MLTVQRLTPEAFAPFGQVLGQPFPGSDAASSFASPASDFWPVHVFDTGSGGQTEVLWVSYRDAAREVASLEHHLLTEQALIPLTGPIVQIMAPSGADGLPDVRAAAAFVVPVGLGLCMKPGSWHATRLPAPGEVRCAMLTRRSTTRDLAAHLNQGAALRESALVPLAPPLLIAR